MAMYRKLFQKQKLYEAANRDLGLSGNQDELLSINYDDGKNTTYNPIYKNLEN